DDLAFVPDVIPGGDDVNVQFEQFFGKRRRNAEASRRVLPIRNNQIDAALAHDLRQPVPYDRPSRPSKNVPNKKNAHKMPENSIVTENVGTAAIGCPSSKARQGFVEGDTKLIMGGFEGARL